MSLQKMKRLHRIVISSLVLLVALIVAYIGMSRLLTGHLGLPFQRTVTLNQAAIYERLENFEIDGDSIRATSERGALLIDAGEATVQRRYLTLFVQQMSDPGMTATIEYIPAEDQAEGATTSFPLLPEQNTVRLLDGNWAGYRIILGTKAGISLIIDNVVLSRFTVVPAYYLPQMIIYAAVICALWYLLFFRSLVERLKAMPSALRARISARLGRKRGTKIAFRTPILSLVLIAALVAVYCVLSIIVSGSIGVPFQNTDILDQAAVYNSTENFEIVGGSIRSTSERGALLIDAGGASVQRQYLTLYVRHPSDPGARMQVEYLPAVGQAAGKPTSFQLWPGQNTVKLRGGNWAGYRVLLGTRDGISMAIDSVALSGHPVLPGYFVPLFLCLAAIICAVWYFIAFRGLGKWLVAHPAALLAVILALQCFTAGYHLNQKSGYSVDEFNAVSQANGELNNVSYWYHDTKLDAWNTPDHYLNYITVQPGEGFNFASVYRTLSGNVHPPFYHMQLHAASSFVPNVWSDWIGFTVNIIWLLAANIMLYKTSALLLKGKLLPLLPSLFWGFSSNFSIDAAFFRMYATAAFFYMAVTWLCAALISGKRKADLRFCVLLALTMFFGCFAHNHFVMFFAVSALGLLLWLLYKKEYIQIRACAITVAITGVVYYLCWPYVVEQLTGAVHGIGAIAEQSTMELLLTNLDLHINYINDQLFGGRIVLAAVVFILLAAAVLILNRPDANWVMKRRINSAPPTKKGGDTEVERKATLKSLFERKGFVIFLIVFLTTAIQFFVIMLTVRYHGYGRYLFPIFPHFALLFVAVMYYLLSGLNKRAAAAIMAAICIFFTMSDFENRNITTVYRRLPDVPGVLQDYPGYSCIILFGGSPTASLYNLTKFERTFICSSEETFQTALIDVSPGDRLILYIAVDTDNDALLEEMRASLPFARAHLIFNDGPSSHAAQRYNVYQIEW